MASGEFLDNKASIWDLRCSNLALWPIIGVGIGHVRDRIKVQRAMCFEEILTMLLREGIDLFLFMRLDGLYSWRHKILSCIRDRRQTY